MITRNFNLFLNAGKHIPLVINVNQYDHDEQWCFTLLNDNGEKYIPSTGAIVGIKADKLGIINSGTVNASGQVVITETEQITAAVGKAVFELLIDDQTHGTANFAVLVEPKPGNNADFSESDLSLLQEAIDGTSAAAIAEGVGNWMDDNLEPGEWVIDSSLTVQGAAADAKKVGDEISDLKSQIAQGGLTEDVKQALMDVVEHIAYWTVGSAETYIENLRTALYPPSDLESITAVYTQSGTVYNTDSLDDLKSDLVVTAYYSDSTSEVVTSYTLSGTLTVGTSEITVAYGGKTATFNVTVTYGGLPSDYQEVEYLESSYSSPRAPGFDTGIKFTNPTEAVFEAGFMEYGSTATQTGGKNRYVAGLYRSDNSIGFGLLIQATAANASATKVIAWSGEPSAVNTITAGSRHDVTAKWTDGKMTLIDNETSYESTQTTREVTQENITVFGLRHPSTATQYPNEFSYYFIGRIYYVRAIEDGVTLFDYVPCYRKSDSVAGFYDKVSNSFITAVDSPNLLSVGSDV